MTERASGSQEMVERMLRSKLRCGDHQSGGVIWVDMESGVGVRPPQLAVAAGAFNSPELHRAAA